MPVFKHQEDDGDLSIFASKNLIVIACENGHYWVIEAKQHSDETVKLELERVLPSGDADALVELF
jgi:hypothetical protein